MSIKEKELKILPLYMDLQAKNLFGTERNVYFTENLLECYLNLPENSLRGCKIENSVVITSELIKGKKIEMDIKVELPNKEIINLEFYSHYDIDSETKSFIYITKVFGSQLNRGSLYSEIKKVKQINFIYEDYLRKINKPILRYAVINLEDPFDYILKNMFEIDIVNLAIKDKLAYNGINKGLADWIRFIGAKDYEKMKEISAGKPILEEALKEMERFSKNEEVQEYFTRDFLDRSREARRKKEDEQRRLEDEKRKKEDERRKIEDEKRKNEDEKRKIEDEKRKLEEAKRKAELKKLKKELKESRKYAENKSIEIAINLKGKLTIEEISVVTNISIKDLENIL